MNRNRPARLAGRPGRGFRLRTRVVRLGGAALLTAVLIPTVAEAQQSSTSEVIYRREVYQYPRVSRPDPFRSLLGTVDLGVRMEDLALRGIVYNQNPRESVAILVEKSNNRRIRARVGERIGGMTVVGIHPRRIDVVVEDFGVPRRESLYLKVETEPGSES